LAFFRVGWVLEFAAVLASELKKPARSSPRGFRMEDDSHRLRASRALDREDLPDGLIFPILASLSVFAEKDNKGKWRLDVPESVEQQLVRAAKQVYMNLAGSSPIMMGRTQPCYALLNMIAVNLKSMSKN